MFYKSLFLVIILLVPTISSRADGVERIWITPAGDQAGRLTIHWQKNDSKTDSELRFGKTGGSLAKIDVRKEYGIFRAEVNPVELDAEWQFQIDEEPARSLRGWDSDVLRIVVVGDWFGNASSGEKAILKDKPHLIITAGDNVPSLHQKGREGLLAYAALVDSAPELFSSVPVLPALGNHDKEIRSRGPKPPADEAVYDISATDFRHFFGLPDENCRWHFQIPKHDISFVALDLHHLSDFGTTWQSSHSFDAESEQLKWLQKMVETDPATFQFFIYNEKTSIVRGLTGGAFGATFLKRNSAVITGYGGFTERAEWKGMPAYNLHITGNGHDYPDTHRKFSTMDGSYLLLTKIQGEKQVTLEIKNHSGDVLDTRVIIPGKG